MTVPDGAVAERPKCKCGLPKSTMSGTDWFFCENCDQVQPQQMVGMARRRTNKDIRFDLAWMKIMHKEYGELPEDVDATIPGYDEEEDDD